ncbi:MAG: hypothetical protein EZS28_042342, partial [Streblomastix strix]
MELQNPKGSGYTFTSLILNNPNQSLILIGICKMIKDQIEKTHIFETILADHIRIHQQIINQAEKGEIQLFGGEDNGNERQQIRDIILLQSNIIPFLKEGTIGNDEQGQQQQRLDEQERGIIDDYGEKIVVDQFQSSSYSENWIIHIDSLLFQLRELFNRHIELQRAVPTDQGHNEKNTDEDINDENGIQQLDEGKIVLLDDRNVDILKRSFKQYNIINQHNNEQQRSISPDQPKLNTGNNGSALIELLWDAIVEGALLPGERAFALNGFISLFDRNNDTDKINGQEDNIWNT